MVVDGDSGNGDGGGLTGCIRVILMVVVDKVGGSGDSDSGSGGRGDSGSTG